MSDFPKGFPSKQCPACQSDRIEVQATVWLRLTNMAADPSTYRGGYMFDLGSPALCGDCDHRAALRDFHDAYAKHRGGA
jgi:hypothetical protein